MDKQVLDALDSDRLTLSMTTVVAESGVTSDEFLKDDLVPEKVA